MVKRARWRRWTLLTAAVSVSFSLAACVPPPFTSSPSALSEENLDTARVTESLESIDGVEDAEVAIAVNGLPGNYSTTTTLTVTPEGDAALGEVLRQAASVIWDEYGTQMPQYGFDVMVPWPDGPTPYELVDLEDREAELGFTQGTYLGGSLVLTKDELAATFGAVE